ncbi:complement factor H-like [Crotalus adamanteus]|uniref:Complement factor H-like n=1 Tax=Crotalus adamanteus TaxID=8729 RepID=A0AAW1BR80_CROAD
MKSWLLLIAAFLLWPGCSSQNVCEEPDDIAFGEIVTTEKAKYLENDQVQYRCYPGYVLEGPEWIQCKGQQWIPHPPKCLAPCSITRQQLATKNLFVFGSQRKSRFIQSNHSLQFQCSEGYVLVAPSVRKFVDGYMDLPLCISERGKNCSAPPRIENGDITTLSEKQYRSGSSVEFRCQRYYAMEGQNRSFCNNGTWTKVPICLDPCMIPRAELETQKIEVKEDSQELALNLHNVITLDGLHCLQSVKKMLNLVRHYPGFHMAWLPVNIKQYITMVIFWKFSVISHLHFMDQKS